MKTQEIMKIISLESLQEYISGKKIFVWEQKSVKQSKTEARRSFQALNENKESFIESEAYMYDLILMGNKGKHLKNVKSYHPHTPESEIISEENLEVNQKSLFEVAGSYVSELVFLCNVIVEQENIEYFLFEDAEGNFLMSEYNSGKIKKVVN